MNITTKKDNIAQTYSYDDWKSMIKSISEFGIDEHKLQDIIESYTVLRVRQVLKQLAEETIQDLEQC